MNGFIDYSDKLIDGFGDAISTRKPDFNNLLKVLSCKKPDRFTLFEFYLNSDIEDKLAGYNLDSADETGVYKRHIDMFRNAGYDYATVFASDFHFPSGTSNHGKSTRSLNESAAIRDRESFEAYEWQSPREMYNGRFERISPYLHDGMKFIVYSHDGILENAIALMGYDNLCYTLADDPELVEMLFDKIGSLLYEYYEIALAYDCVGACILNDDWGFNTQTFLSHEDMRKYVVKWHKRIVELVHGSGRPAILHSCGQLTSMYDDIIDDIKFDAKHSYEDNIQAVEDAYAILNPRIAVLGGIDVDFICRKSPTEVYERACKMLAKTADKGGYALGSGNSIPTYVPIENYMALIAAAVMN